MVVQEAVSVAVPQEAGFTAAEAVDLHGGGGAHGGGGHR